MGDMTPIIFSIILPQLTTRRSGRACWVTRAKCSLASWLASGLYNFLFASCTVLVLGIVSQQNPIVIVKHMLGSHGADGIGP